MSGQEEATHHASSEPVGPLSCHRCRKRPTTNLETQRCDECQAEVEARCHASILPPEGEAKG